MMEGVVLLQRVVAQTTGIVDGIRSDQLANRTPCTDWSVRDLINHIAGGATMFAVSAEQGSVPDEMVGQLMGGDNLGDDYKGAWKQASTRAMAAFDQPGVMDRVVKLPFGEVPAGVALNIAIFDVTTHAADLADATGQKITDDELIETALGIGRQVIGPDLRQPGVFDAERPAPPGASPVQQLLAFAGRQV
jgi:uncharacterized protein (TIGR03086 family)